MSEVILFVLIVVPCLAALACFLIRSTFFRSSAVVFCACATAIASLLLRQSTFFRFTDATVDVFDLLVAGGDFLFLGIMFLLGCRYRHPLIVLLSSCQLILFAWLEFFVFAKDGTHALFQVDVLSLTLVRVVCMVGGLICLHAIPYMQTHEEHLRPARSRQPEFFAALLLFVGAMNGLVLTNNLAYFYFFFELTTICSFFLIRHDGTEDAVANALTALWMNALGGLLLLFAIWGFHAWQSTLAIDVLSRGTEGGFAAMLPLALLIIAAFTKSAQPPWQKWLLGAMAAPTPTSALLHSSTMVKAGVYLALRFSPAFGGTMLAHGLILAGGFTFLAAAALAIGQRNAKKVLAYSTISNLGLIFACAGIGTPNAMAAAIMLIVFHAVSKGLLFLCVGTAEQQVRSRDIEVMRGLCATMPFTGMVAVLGVLTLIVPPFGMLLGKWMILEAGADNILFYLMLVMGSACTLLYWVRLAGTLLTGDETAGVTPETKIFLTRLPLTMLVCAALVLGFSAPLLYGWVIASLHCPPDWSDYTGRTVGLVNAVGSFPLVALFAGAALAGLCTLIVVGKSGAGKKDSPYLAGVNVGQSAYFLGPMNRPVRAVVENYYLPAFFGEERLTPWVNLAAVGLLLFLLGGWLWM